MPLTPKSLSFYEHSIRRARNCIFLPRLVSTKNIYKQQTTQHWCIQPKECKHLIKLIVKVGLDQHQWPAQHPDLNLLNPTEGLGLLVCLDTKPCCHILKSSGKYSLKMSHVSKQESNTILMSLVLKWGIQKAQMYVRHPYSFVNGVFKVNLRFTLLTHTHTHSHFSI